MPAHAQDATPVSETDWATVEALARDAEGPDGVVGVAVFGAAGELFARHGERRFHAASTIKVPIMIEAYRQIEAGLLDPDDTHVLRDEDRVPGSGVLSHLHAGLELTVRDLINLMITVSDNTATNLVLERIGLDAVNATMPSLGMRDSILGRPMLGRLPKAGEPENWATPRDFARCVQAIVNNEAAGAVSCAHVMETLQLQTGSRRISRFLELALAGGAGIIWGTKPGDLPGVFNDVGFVTTERGTLSMAIFCEHLSDLDTAERAIGEIARAALAVTGIASPS
jgi:beta-lactamase class A